MLQRLSNNGRLALGLGMALAACGDAVETPELDLSSVESRAVGNSPGGTNNFDVFEQPNGYLVELYNVPAEALFEVLASSGLSVHESRRGQIVIGARVGCLSSPGASFCQILTPRFEDDLEGYEVTVHGRRFASAASEIFGAVARSQSIDPASVGSVTTGSIDCGKSRSAVWCGFKGESETTPTPARFLVRLVGLESLGPTAVYEGWFITSNGPVSSGRFDVTEPDETFEFETDLETARDTSAFVLTIEPAQGDDPAPADTHYLAGDFQNGIAQIRVEHGAALGSDFADAAGDFILATPSAPEADDRFGIWFLNPAEGAPSLELPMLPPGWAYEGWVVGENGPVSTGRFTSVAGADSDGAGPAAGPMAGPPFPGQDFINPPMDLVGTTVVISVEPEPDNSPGPFTLKPLAETVHGSDGGVLMPLTNQTENGLPAGACGFFDSNGNLIR